MKDPNVDEFIQSADKWQAEMAEFFVALEGKRPDEGFLQLEEVFHLN